MVLIFGSLEAIAVYLNHQTFAKDIMQDECGRVEFYLEGNQFLGAIYKFHDETWLCDMEKNPREASVIVRFEDLKTGINAALGRVDPLIDPVQHRLRIEGRLPLLEKISYVSRMVSKELPLPIKSPYAAF